MKKFLLVLLGIILIFAAVLLFNAFTLESRQIDAEPLAQPELPGGIYDRLAGAVTYPTISYSEDAIPDSAAFKGFHQFLDSVFPRVHENLELTLISEYSLLYRWEGSDPAKKPVIFMSHQDVVPVDQPTLADWEAGPFEGVITDEYVIGRGTMDDKGTLMALMESVELLLGEGYKPGRTIYLAFGHDEEVGGSNGAAKIAEYLEQQGVEALMTIDEGGYLAQDLVPGVDAPVAVINLAEKGFASFDLVVETGGGHSSQPPRENTIGILAQAIVDLENNQRPYKMVEPINHTLAYMGPELPFAQRVAFANPWLLDGPILEAMNAHTTTAPTIITGGVKNNVIPTVARATINFRILPGETIETVEEHIRSTVHDTIRVEPTGFLTNPSPVSKIDSEGFRVLQRTIRGLFPEAVVVPSLVGGGTDARYFYGISEDVYRFYPMRLSPENASRFHGIDEKISKENYSEIIGFTYHLIRELD